MKKGHLRRQKPSHSLRRTQKVRLTRSKPFADFQNNLLSLVSHELRTPMTGVRNAIVLLQESRSQEDRAGAMAMLERNAAALEHNLKTVLDLSKIELGHFRPRLREIDLRSALLPLVQAIEGKVPNIKWTVDDGRLLADPSMLARAVEVGATIVDRLQCQADMNLGVKRWRWILFDVMDEGPRQARWMSLVDQLAKVDSARAMSRAAQVLQSETGFLARKDEGLGVELVLLEELFRAQRSLENAKDLEQSPLHWRAEGRNVVVELHIDALNEERALEAVLASRLFEATGGVVTVALVWIKVPKGVASEQLAVWIRESLFRSSDSVYAVQTACAVALVLHDCRAEDVPRLMDRVQKSLAQGLHGQKLAYGFAVAPKDGLTPEDVLRGAKRHR